MSDRIEIFDADLVTFRLRPDQPDPMSREALRRLRDWEEEDPEELMMQAVGAQRLGTYLRRYCNGEMDGFSVLLAGQRGAGKTTLAKVAIQAAIKHRTGLIPLPIFLHGPTIIDASADEAKGEEKNASAEKSPPVTVNVFYGPPEPVKDLPAAAKPEDGQDPQTRARKSKANALPRLMTALYRHLSVAMCDAWRSAAYHAPHRRRRTTELLELAGHLDRLLELAPGPEPLRKLWKRGGFLRYGVAFHLFKPHRPPQPAPRWRMPGRSPPIAGDRRDQGVREIVALAACADVFRGVIGTTREIRRSNRSSAVQRQSGLPVPAGAEKKEEEKKEKSEKKDEDRKETGAKIGPPAIGAVAGLATLQASGSKNALVALLLGAVVWSISWFVWNYAVTSTSRRGLENESVTEIDWTQIRVLERLFPAVIQRVKDAGFAPIFVFDELDKMENAKVVLEDFLRLTKHFATDEAAFFFLVNRDYYEADERAARGEA